ncbi:iron-containing redox enzyme family protein [Caenimonas terrae]|uniref:Iron-containing redox enzyme family protein n=1 Tax=Caenimonas terrae TaxID=696074 RepID=A0ABW0ND19_9BURK
MYIAEHEWSAPRTAILPTDAEAGRNLSRSAGEGRIRALYRRLAEGDWDDAGRAEAAQFLREQLAAAGTPDALPESPQDLTAWMQANAQAVAANYSIYLEQRAGGAPRRYFGNRAHALHFLRSVAPTKLVDGAWLYGLLPHWRNGRFDDLVRTYVEELGEGAADKNHVLLYRKLLVRYGLDPLDDLSDELHVQGLVQLALACNAEDFLPEVIGFNLGYEQLPLHLLISAYELNELGLDPYYFTLHVTVDNCDSGHAMRACKAVLETLPRIGDASDYWRRIRAGARLADAGAGTGAVIAGFDIEAEVVRILANKSGAGRGAHSDYCQVAGRKVNDWLSQPQQVPAFLAALQQAGWIKLGAPVEQSRFWGLLQGERAEMFGVFSSYELQVIHDWIRGDAASDGQPFAEHEAPAGRSRRPTFRAQAKLAAARGQAAPVAAGDDAGMLDPDLQALCEQLPRLADERQMQLLVQAMSPAQHWTPAGLHATRLFWERVRS